MKNNYIQNIELSVNSFHYDASVLNDVININEDDYTTLDIRSVKGSIVHVPHGIEPGQVYLLSKLVIDEALSNPILSGIIGKAIYDLIKYIASKIPSLKRNCNLDEKTIYILTELDIINGDTANVLIDLSFYSDEYESRLETLGQLIETINSTNIKGDVRINCHSGKWHISNNKENS